TKNNSLSGPINRNFALLGDPSLKLIYPKYNILINDIDTLKSGGKVVITGDIVDQNNEKIKNFNGEVFSEVFDKMSLNQTLGDESTPYSFNEWDDIIFRGYSSVINGAFSFEFTVPVNIDYNFDKGRINLFATDTISFQEAIDHSDLIIGGTSNQFNSDEEGPEINIFIDDINFISGDEVSKSPLLIVEAYDQSGLNLTNMNSYQKMIGIVNDTTIIYLNDYFTYNKDDYQRGIIRYPLGDLGSGRHKIEIKITDNYNNLSSNSVVFIIGENNRLNIKNVMNFPNPFSDYTTFKFDLPQEGQSIFVNLEIYDLRGNKVYNYTHTYEFSPLVVEDIYWNGNDLNNYPLPQGIYIYKLHVNNLVNGKKVTVHNKVFKKL
ncbi:MAG: T9SS type A sorting domain-containing protein, partial [Bacteroidota bacterium]|nr:T9SS type A sorting domain-containing protein [Bacteroidota bacterium]